MDNYLGLNNRNDSISLTDGCIASQDVSVLKQSLVRWDVLADLQNASPFGELATVLLVLSAALVKVIQTLGGALALRAHKVDNSSVDLDTGQDSLLLEQLNEGSAIIGLLVKGLVVEDHTRDAFFKTVVSGEKKLQGNCNLTLSSRKLSYGTSITIMAYGSTNGKFKLTCR